MTTAVETLLEDGTRVLFRRLRPEDRERIERGFHRLSPESRYRRFFRRIDRLSDSELDYLTQIDFKNHWAWAAVLPDEPGEPGIGVARWIRAVDEPTSAEAAITVIDDYQGRGIGKALLLLLASSAIENGVRSLRAWTMGDNQIALRLLRAAGAQSTGWESGILEVIVPLPKDPSKLDRSAAPLLLRAAATGEIRFGIDEKRAGETSAPDQI